ncbi:Type 1 glutamine amidotransferase-like domain-containing protein [Ornithinimicrobium faecis]|uniref:Type 1 glutamine amidotransferase-like domain-containing protein n=1 Tax=Ornithinimicrobium faecis TaxID=2934158 RepID=A0ABY4YWL6_9MICO|nr:Type 1 glutamine amidotransferase-like domain-containing protein [Ornithinimicrobium sp. HY1793]USQ81161.1 Type 1 glutamine amidotransferase-like domain-containing protein [Ornithinimicrobium sp. HY1793]
MRRRPVLSLVLAACLAAPVAAYAANPDDGQKLVPIGGGYSEESLHGFAAQTIDGATGDTVDLYVIPSSYGDAPEDREENLALAQERTVQIEAACDDVVDLATFTGGCEATLLPLLAREDALDPAASEGLDDTDTDGVYILGGDQVLAMHVLANSPAEERLATAYAQGVVISGTSAGNAVQSRSMGAGYPEPGYPENALERDMSLIFWGDDLASEERGLSFGSQEIILDQHFYERGRFGRLLSWTAQSVERYGGAGKLGVGVDWGTAPVIQDDATITSVLGASSVSVLDFSAAQGLDWVGDRDTLSVQSVLVHLLAPDTGATYDFGSRSVAHDDVAVPTPERVALPSLATRGQGTLWLGGGDNNSIESEALSAFVAQAQDNTRGKGKTSLLVLGLGYADEAGALDAVTDYTEAVAELGWTGGIDVRVHGHDAIPTSAVARAAGVLVVGGDQSLMAEEVADPELRSALAKAVQRPTPVLTDGAATAILGERYVTDIDPTTSDEAIEMFRANAVITTPGLGLIPGYTLEPTLTQDYRWGRLFGAAHDSPDVASLGISELTAIEVGRGGASVVGERSVVAVDGSGATWSTGSNGALGATNVWLDVFSTGDLIE